MESIKDPEANKIVAELLQNIKVVLAEKLVGVYVYGSLATGDFYPKTSDIDMLAAISVDLKEEEFKNLKKMHEEFILKYQDWNNRIEVHYLSTKALKTFKSTTSKVASIRPGDPFQMIEVGDHWLMNWYMVREKGITLYGPSPKTIIEPISKEEFIDSVKQHTKSWNEWVKPMKNRKAQAYSILTLCRALYAVENGEQPSKKHAALWAEKQLPEWATLIKNAITWRESEVDVENDEENYNKTVEFVNVVRNRVLSA